MKRYLFTITLAAIFAGQAQLQAMLPEVSEAAVQKAKEDLQEAQQKYKELSEAGSYQRCFNRGYSVAEKDIQNDRSTPREKYMSEDWDPDGCWENGYKKAFADNDIDRLAHEVKLIRRESAEREASGQSDSGCAIQ